MDWNFLNTGYQSGAFNMELDESLVKALSTGYGSPTLRVYGWRPFAISLGWNQRPDEINEEAARRDGLDIVRRPTGGRAILHSEELTYSVVMESSTKNILSVYNDISQALVCGLRRLGAHASLEKSQPHFPSLYKSPSSAVCFSSSARYEIQIDGRKLVGSAQRRFAGESGAEFVLQHGSLLLGPHHGRLVEYLNLPSENERDRLRLEIEEKTIDLAEAVGRTVTFAECAEAVRAGFEEAWGITLQSTEPEPVRAGATV